MEKLLEQVLQEITPDEEETIELRQLTHELISKLSKRLTNAKLFFAGSGARGTALKGDCDVDIFAAFPRSIKREKIVSMLKKAARGLAKWEMHYAEHPYFQTEIDGVKVELIPCYDMKPGEKVKSAVDRTPLHLLFLEEKLHDSQKKDVLLLKRFLKGQRLYGAEARVKGFSGLFCEYLILKYGSFDKVLQNASSWRFPQVVDLSGNLIAAKKFAELKESEQPPVVLIDPVDHYRNVAAALSWENASRFVLVSRKFLKQPSKEFFFPRKEVTGAKPKPRGTCVLGIECASPKVVEDVLFPQLEHSAKSISKHLSIEGFRVVSTGFSADERKSRMVFELEHRALPRVKKAIGPPVWQAQACEAFLKKHSGTRIFLEKDRLCADEERENKDAREFLKKIISSPRLFGISSHYLKELKNGRISYSQNVLQNAIAAQVV
jgi:tRNA nucleotidyltransferase (CCA-adding enzyme)